MSMLYIILGIVGALILLGVFAAIAGRTSRKRQAKEGNGSVPEPKIPDSECCGAHEICEKESLLSAVSKEIVYYDDEELDRFSGLTP